MSLQAFLFRHGATRGDRKRNGSTTFPEGVVCRENIRYGSEGKDHLLNVYFPEGTTEPLPTIVSIHGGGYVYGDKEVYHFYCADLARRGFTVVNFNYRLAPKHKFPAPLEDTNRVMKWLCTCARKYHMDPDRLFVVGDSAGAQLASQYAAIATNPAYAKRFGFAVPEIHIRALGLNCGMYDVKTMTSGGTKGLSRDYLGRKFDLADPRLDVLGAVTGDYPPSFVLTGESDFLKDAAEPMALFLGGKGIDTQYHCFGNGMGHVFHVDIRLPESHRANDLQCAFFRNYLE